MVQIYEKVKASRSSALGCLTPVFAKYVESIPEEIQSMDELSLEEYFTPSPKDYILRKRLWFLVSQPGASGLDQTLIAGDIMSKQNLSLILQNAPHRFMWIFTPLETFEEMYEETFYVLYNKLRRYITTTKIDAKNLGPIMQLFSKLEDRVLGPVAKNINVRTQKVPSQPSDLKNVTPEELDQKIKELESRSMTATPADVLPE